MSFAAAALVAPYREHIRRLTAAYAESLQEHSLDGVLIHSGTPKLKTIFDDAYWPLRVTPHFQHWLPLVHEDCALLIVPGKKPVLYRNVSKNFWERPGPPESDHFWAEFDVVDVDDPAHNLKALLPGGRKLAFVGEDTARATAWGFAPEGQTPASLAADLDELRVVKSPYEELLLAEANRRAAAGHHAVAKAFHSGDHAELDLHLLYLGATRQDDPETPYKNIVALGVHAATLHHIHYGRSPVPAQSLLLDAGATCLGYASDITRTYVKGASAEADAFGALIGRMERLQQEMCRRVVLDAPYEALHDQSHKLLAPVLRELGLIAASDEELVTSGVTRMFLPHGLGHSLGLQTHDVGCAQLKPRGENPFLRNTTRVAAGQVFTIEPGCYFIDDKLDELRRSPVADRVDWKLVDALRGFGGVRIEDDLAVHADGVRNLTREVIPA